VYSRIRISIEKQQLNKVVVTGAKPLICSLPHSPTHHTHRLTTVQSFVNFFTHSLTCSFPLNHMRRPSLTCSHERSYTPVESVSRTQLHTRRISLTNAATYPSSQSHERSHIPVESVSRTQPYTRGVSLTIAATYPSNQSH
jgi:hypothetical protein